MVKSRVPMQVSPEFERRLKELQVKIMKKDGKNVSLRELTERLTRTMDLDDLEKSIMKPSAFEIQVTMDRRRRK
jgi:hypothetical protein